MVQSQTEDELLGRLQFRGLRAVALCGRNREAAEGGPAGAGQSYPVGAIPKGSV